MSVSAIGSIIGGIYIAGVKPHPRRTLAIALAGFAVACLALSIAPGYWPFVAMSVALDTNAFECGHLRIERQADQLGLSSVLTEFITSCNDRDMTEQQRSLTRVGVALADPVRQRVLIALLDGPAHPAELSNLIGTTRANLSNHLACLRGCGLVTTTPVGRRVRYELASDDLAHALQDLLKLELTLDCAQPVIPAS